MQSCRGKELKMAEKKLLSRDAISFPSHVGPFASPFKMQVFGGVGIYFF